MVLDFIKQRRTIRKYKKGLIPSEEALEDILSAVRLIYAQYPIPFKLYIVSGRTRLELIPIIRQHYSIFRDLSLIGKEVSEEMRPAYEKLMVEFMKDLGGAPITLIGLTKLYDWKEEKEKWPDWAIRNWKISWMIAQTIMLYAKKNGLDTGSLTCASTNIEDKILEFLEERDLNIAFILNLGYGDENPIPKNVDWKVVEI
jgi:nitroreductase